MNSFRADELLLTFDELKPFSDVLRDEMLLHRLHRMYKSIDRHDDDCLLRHILCLVALMENALRADPPLIKSLQNNLIELTLLVEKAKSCVSKDYVGIAIGILFKYSAALLDVQQGSDDQVSFILNSLAYHHLCMVALKDVMISAWIAMHLLEVAAAITCSNVTEDQISHLWHREDLAEYCVDTLIPSEGCIQRLHSGVYRNGVIECHTCWPTITVKQICNLFDRIQPVLHREEILRTIVWMIGHDSTFEEMALFDDLLQKSLSNSSDFNSATLTTTDVKVFLFTLSLWSDSTSHPAALPGRLHIKVNQINCWKAICQLINNAPNADNVKSVLLRSRVIDSVRLRHRVVCLRRLYEVFRWLEANVDDKSWLTVYATTISDTITRVHSYRRRCDELFPGGTDTDVEYTVDEIDSIEEHVSRYLASELLLKKEFGEAERKLVYANSIESKRLLIKVYEAWLVDGYLEEHERDQLSKRVRELKVNCEKYISPVPHLSSQSGIVSPPSTTDKVLVDVCTNTPCRADLSTLLSTGDEDESFFSIKSDRTNVSDRSYASAITSPVGPDPRQRLLREKISGISLAQELNGDKKMSSERQRGKPTAADKLSKSGNLSVTPTTQVVFSGRMEDRSLNGLASCQSSEYSAFSQTGTSGVIPNNTLVDSTNTVSKNTLFNGFASVTKPPCGKVLDKDEATSFWKGKSVGLPIFGRSQANITASDTNNVFGQQALKNVAPVSSVLGKAANMPCEHFSSPISGFAGQRNSDLGECSPLDALIPVISQTPQNIDSFSSTVNAEDQNEDENFYNNLVMELCQRRMGGSSKKLDPDSTDMEALQRKITQIEEQMRKTRSRLCGSTKMPTLDLSSMTTTPTSTPSEIRREKQHETLLELERKVAQLMNSQILSNISPQPTMTVPSAKPLNSKRSDVPCADPINLFRGLLMSSSNSGDCANLGKPMTEVMENTKITSTALKSSSEVKVQSDVAHNPLQSMERLARHAGNSGLCLGCMDDDAQDLALRILEQLANDWNTICDSDSD